MIDAQKWSIYNNEVKLNVKVNINQMKSFSAGIYFMFWIVGVVTY